MEEVWDLPDIKRIQPIGQDWLKTLLLAATETQRAMMLMTFWRIWHAHNELTHGKECPSIDGSRRFLVSYLNSLMVIKQFPEADIGKGKMVVDHRQGFKEVATKERTKTIRPRWKPPDDLATKLNVDGGFSSTRQVGSGIYHSQGLEGRCAHCGLSPPPKLSERPGSRADGD
jgi:hypothetical protein